MNASKTRSMINKLKKLSVDNFGNVTMMTAALVPAAIAITGIASDLTTVALEKKALGAAVSQACDRAVKTRLVNFPTAASRKKAAEDAFDSMYAQVSTLKAERQVTVVGREATINAQVSVPLNFAAAIDDGASKEIEDSAVCNSIPAYPKMDEIIYDSTFNRYTDGTEFTYSNGSWGIIDPARVGWRKEMSYQKNPYYGLCGLEVQNWSKGGFVSRFRALPPGWTSPIVLELDGHCNTTLSKVFELHPGTYEFSFWYRGRYAQASDTNQIGIYLTPADPETFEATEQLSDSNKRLTLNDPDAGDWVKYDFQLTTDEYSLYRLYIRGEGKDDTLGGLLSTMRITYKGVK